MKSSLYSDSQSVKTGARARVKQEYLPPHPVDCRPPRSQHPTPVTPVTRGDPPAVTPAGGGSANTVCVRHRSRPGPAHPTHPLLWLYRTRRRPGERCPLPGYLCPGTPAAADASAAINISANARPAAGSCGIVCRGHKAAAGPPHTAGEAPTPPGTACSPAPAPPGAAVPG